MARLLFIFDLDGTLVDSVGDLATAVNLTRAGFGLGPIPVETVAGYVGNGIRTLMERALRDQPGADLDQAADLTLHLAGSTHGAGQSWTIPIPPEPSRPVAMASNR